MGSNFTEQSIQRSARSVSALHDLAETFDRESHTPVPTTAHSTKSDDVDVRRVVSVLLKKEVLALKPGRAHSHFAGISSDPMVNISMKEMLAWIAKKQKQTTKFNEAIGEGNLSDSEASDDLWRGFVDC